MFIERNNAEKLFVPKTWVHKKTCRSSSRIPNFSQNYNELKINLTVKN